MASPLQAADAGEQRVGRRPQTSEPVMAGGPFLRHTRESRVQGFDSSGNAFGGLINQPLKAVPGYIKYLDLYLAVDGAADTGGPPVLTADAPYNLVQNYLFKDAFGQSIIQGSGYTVNLLLALYSGQHGFWNSADPANLPSFTAVDAEGNFNFRTRLPLELFDGFCSIAGANASAVPSLTATLAGEAAVYSTAPDDNSGTVRLKVQESYYAVPLDDPNLAPPDNGSSHQWSEQTAGTTIASGGNTSVQLPPLGSFLTTLILVVRNALGARDDSILPAAGGSLELWVDGVPLFIEDMGTRRDLMFQEFGVDAPEGVIVYSFRNSVQNFGPVSALDTGDLYLPTTPGTLLEWRSSAWGSFANGPAQVTVISGRVYAAGGIPYTHLSD